MVTDKRRIHVAPNSKQEERRYNKFEPGDLVVILTERTHSSDNLTTAFTCGGGGIKLYSTIEINGYPSCSDFKGDYVECMPGQTASVVRYVGRPSRIRQANECWEYDVYEVLTGGQQVHVFANNIRMLRLRSTKA